MNTSNVAPPLRAAEPPAPAILPTLTGIVGGIIALGLIGAGLYFNLDSTAKALSMGGIALPALWLVWRRPEVGLVVLLFLTSSFLPRDVISLRLPFGGLDIRDLAFLALGGMLVVQQARRGRLILPWWPVSRLLLLFLAIGIFSAGYALLLVEVDPNWTFSELRPLMYYAVFFFAAWTVVGRSQLLVVLGGAFAAADLTGAIVIAQQFLGQGNPILAAMSHWLVWQASEADIGFGGVRIVPPGHVLMYVMSIIAFCLLIYARQSSRLRIFCALQWLGLNAALLFTYTRAQWIASAIAMALLLVLLPLADKLQFARILVITGLALGLILTIYSAEVQQFLAKAAFVDTLVARAASIFAPDDTLASDSLQWRVYETGEAVRSISQHPVMGVGLGNSYRDITLLGNEAQGFYFRRTRYVHNSFLYLGVKMGLPGLLAFLLFAGSFLVYAWRAYQSIQDVQRKRITLALLVSFVGIMQWSLSQMHLMSVESTFVVGLIPGLVAGMRSMQEETPWQSLSTRTAL